MVAVNSLEPQKVIAGALRQARSGAALSGREEFEHAKRLTREEVSGEEVSNNDGAAEAAEVAAEIAAALRGAAEDGERDAELLRRHRLFATHYLTPVLQSQKPIMVFL